MLDMGIRSIARSKYFTQGHIWFCQGFQTIISRPVHVSVIPKYKNKCDFQRKQSLRSLNSTVRNIAVYSGVEPGSLPPSDPSPNSWKMWLLGMVISTILPFWANKWGPFKSFEKQVEAVVQTAEDIAEFVEDVAEGVEKVAEEVADDLPQGKLKDVATCVENVARIAAKDAHLADEIIDKVQDIEKEVESVIDPVNDQAHETTKD